VRPDVSDDWVLEELVQRGWRFADAATLRAVIIVLQRDHQRINALEERIAALEQQGGRPPIPGGL
jgi:hypothetical protein